MDPTLSAAGRRTAPVLLVCCLLLSLSTGVAAAESVRGAAGTIVVDEGETVERVEAVAGTVVIRGTVTGDFAGAAGTVQVAETGRVAGDVSVAAGTVRIDGTVGGDLNAGAGTLEVTETGRIGGAVNAGASYLAIDGRVDGDVDVGADTVVLGPNARVSGDVRYDAETFDRDPGATVSGTVVAGSARTDSGAASRTANLLGAALAAVYGVMANLVLGALLLVVFPDFSAGVASRIAAAPVRTGGVGLLVLLAVPILAVLAMVTLVGIPLAVVALLGFAGAVWAGSVYGQYAVGVGLLAQIDRDHRWLALLVGVVGVTAVGSLPILGPVVQFGTLLVGLGALTVGLRDAYRGPSNGQTDRQATLDETFDGADSPE
jgi:cytoskeletal protein CcmA (bactofilin family)